MTKSKLKLPNPPKNPLLYLLVLLTTLIVGFFSGSFYSEQQQFNLPTRATVARVIDGDNLELDNGQSIRLYGVGCPEKGEKFSQEAIDLSTKLALNKQITIDYQPNYSKDRWERLLGYVFIDDSFINEELIRQGYCQVTIYEKRAKLKYQDELIQAQEQAKQEKVGVWK